MNKISKLEQYVTQTHTGKNVVSHYLTKADDDDEGNDPSFIDNLTSIGSSTIGVKGQEVPPQYRKYASSFPGGQIPDELSSLVQQGSKGKDFIDVRALDHNGKDDALAPDPNLPTRYGGIVFNEKGEILLRSPKGSGFGNRWTFAKGGADPNEDPTDAAIREVEEETGMKCEIVQAIPGSFKKEGQSNNKYFLMKVKEDTGSFGSETSDIKWASPKEAIKHLVPDKKDRPNDWSKEGAHRDVMALHMAIHTKEKNDNHASKVDTALEFLKTFEDNNLTDVKKAFTDLHDEVFANAGEFPKEFYKDKKYSKIRDILRYSFLNPDSNTSPSDKFGTTTNASQIGDAMRGLLDGWSKIYGTMPNSDKSIMRAFHDELDSSYTGSHESTLGSVINDIVGELHGIPDNYIAGNAIAANVDTSGNPVYRNFDEMNEIIDAYQQWKAGGSATGQLSDKYHPEFDTMVEGEKFDFEGEKTLKMGNKKVAPWVMIAERATSARDKQKHHQGSIDSSIEFWGKRIADSTSVDASDSKELGRKMIRDYVKFQTRINRSVLDAIAPNSDHVILYRGTQAAREIGGDIGTGSGKGATKQTLIKNGMTEDASNETSKGFKTRVHARPVSGYSVDINTANSFAKGNYIIAEKVAKHRVLSLPIQRTNFSGEKEVVTIADPTAKAQVYYGTKNNGHLIKSPDWKLSPTANGYEVPDMWDIGTETPHGPWYHAVNSPNVNAKDQFTPTGEVLGETDAQKYTDSSGNAFYIKHGSEEQNAVEHLSNQLYKAAGIPVADTELINWDNSQALKSSWVEDGKYFGKENDKSYQPPELENHPDIHKGFLMDCVLSNWDVAGAGVKRPYGNIIQGKDGKMYRIDHGGSLYMSGLGYPSKQQFFKTNSNEPLEELKTMRSSDINPSAAHLFKSMPKEALHDSYKAMLHGVGTEEKLEQMVMESGIKDNMKPKVLESLKHRRNSIMKWMKEEHPETADAAMDEYLSEWKALQKGSYKIDPRVEYLINKPDLSIDDSHRDSIDTDAHDEEWNKIHSSIINNTN